ncbi:serine hydrolase [candidate division KSB1 bacterium]|nr:serine hydrolase [candidate division KSB1 bacterium]
MKRNYSILICAVFLFLLFSYCISFAQNKADKINQLMHQYEKIGQFSGVVLVAEKGNIIYKKAFGYANMDLDVVNQINTKFRIASMTKAFTAMLIMQLVEEGKVQLNEKVTNYLLDYPKPQGDNITIHHLLTHTSGMLNYTNINGFWANETRNPYTMEQLVKVFSDSALVDTVGTKYRYNNGGYVLLGAIVEKVTGKTFEEALNEKILKSLGMKNSGYDKPGNILKNRATGYNKTLLGYQPSPYQDMTSVSAAGCMYSTIDDLYLWDRALYTEKLLSESYKQKMFTPNLSNYGYGWGIGNEKVGDKTDSVTVIAHNGGVNGFTSRIMRVSEDQHLVILLRNMGVGGITGISRKIMAILYDQPFDIPKISAGEIAAKTMLESGIPAGLQKFEELKCVDRGKYSFEEMDMNGIGYQLIGLGKVKEAIEIFKLNVAAHPKSANTYDSLAEAYMTNGDNENAIKYYKMAIEKLPGDVTTNNDLKEMIKTGAAENIKKMLAEKK